MKEASSKLGDLRPGSSYGENFALSRILDKR
jgi:hypothetical protein